MELKYFKDHEFRCKCGKCGRGQNYMDEDFLLKLDELREQVGISLSINSGTRCPEHNKKVGGASKSEHVAETTHSGKTTAVDISCTDSNTRFKILKAAMNIGFPRIGLHKSFIHLGTSKAHPQEVVFFY